MPLWKQTKKSWKGVMAAGGMEGWSGPAQFRQRNKRLPPLDSHYSNGPSMGDHAPPQQLMKKGLHTSSWQQSNPHIASSKETNWGRELYISGRCEGQVRAWGTTFHIPEERSVNWVLQGNSYKEHEKWCWDVLFFLPCHTALKCDSKHCAANLLLSQPLSTRRPRYKILWRLLDKSCHVLAGRFPSLMLTMAVYTKYYPALREGVWHTWHKCKIPIRNLLHYCACCRNNLWGSKMPLPWNTVLINFLLHCHIFRCIILHIFFKYACSKYMHWYHIDEKILNVMWCNGNVHTVQHSSGSRQPCICPAHISQSKLIFSVHG